MYSIARDYTNAVRQASNTYVACVTGSGFLYPVSLVQFGGPNAIRWYIHNMMKDAPRAHAWQYKKWFWHTALDTMRDELVQAVIQYVNPKHKADLLVDVTFYEGDLRTKLVYTLHMAIRHALHRRHPNQIIGFIHSMGIPWRVQPTDLLWVESLEILVNDRAFRVLSVINAFTMCALWDSYTTTRQEAFDGTRNYIKWRGRGSGAPRGPAELGARAVVHCTAAP